MKTDAKVEKNDIDIDIVLRNLHGMHQSKVTVSDIRIFVEYDK